MIKTFISYAAPALLVLLIPFKTVHAALSYSMSTVSVPSTAPVLQGSTGQAILGINIITSGSGGTLNATSFAFNTNGTTSAADIQNAKVYFTGSSSTFTTTTQFGSTFSSPSGNFAIGGTQSLSSGNNWFWLAYDITAAAVKCNVVDGESVNIIVGGTTYTPTGSGPISGNRMVNGTMTYTSATATQANTSDAGIGSTNNEIIGIHLVTPGSVSPFTTTSFTFTTTGSTSPSDITGAKLWFTGSSAVFATTTLVGSFTSPSGSFTIPGSVTLSGCDNYFWLTYDISTTAVAGNIVDATCTSFILSSGTYAPSVTAPAGARTIAALTYYQVTNDVSGGYSELWSIEPTSDGGYISCGPFNNGAAVGGFFLLKTNSDGSVGWTKDYGGSNTDDGEQAKQTSDGGYVAVGYTSTFGSGWSDGYVLKTDAGGSIGGAGTWSNAYGGAGIDEFYNIEVTTGGYLMVGKTTSYGADPGISYNDIYLVKINGSGSVLWSKTYGISGSSEYGSSVRQTTDGGFVIGGYGSATYLVKISSTGALQWSKSYTPAVSGQNCVDARQTTDGGYILTGASGMNIFVIKTNPSGVVSWAKNYAGTSSATSYQVIQTTNGGYAVAGGGFATSGGFGMGDAALLRLDPSGNPLWTQAYGGSRAEYAGAVAETSDGGFIFGGGSDSFHGPGNEELFIVKTDPSGNSGCNNAGASYTVSSYAPVENSNVLTDNGSGVILTANPPTTVNNTVNSSNTLCQLIPVLPTELLSFSGRHENAVNVLEWTTASEVNNDFFSIERSADGKTFDNIGTVKASGISSAGGSYRFTDLHPFPSVTYYTLRQTDFYGHYSYSRIISVSSGKDAAVFVYPNPSGAFIFVDAGNSPADAVYEASITDIAGKVVCENRIQVHAAKIDVSFLPGGMYFLQLSSGSQQSRFKFVKE